MKEKLLQFFSKHTFDSFNPKQVSVRLGINDKAGRQQINELMLALAQDNVLIEQARGKYKINLQSVVIEETPHNTFIGTVDMKSTGKAYVIPQNKSIDDVFIAANQTHHALHNDLVKVFLFPSRRGRRPEGRIIEVLQRHKTKFVGALHLTPKYAFVVPDSTNMPIDLFIPGDQSNIASEGQKVLAEIIEWPDNLNNPIGKIVHVLGNPGENNVEMQSILAEFGFPLSFPEHVELEAEKIPMEIPVEEIPKRRDFRAVTTVTIDPADAKDFDDALSFRQLDNGNVEVGVHIADVSYYVRPQSVIDQEAYIRATSVYLVDRTIPMLPEKLSNGVCSLRPNEDKLTFSAVFEMDKNANVVKQWFGKTMIHSDRRFAYEEAQTIIEEQQGELSEVLLPLHNLASILRKKRFETGAIDFHTQEVRFQLDEQAKPIGVYLKENKEANWLVEEFMLLANKKVAERVGMPKSEHQNSDPQKAKTFVYRVHDEPNAEKLSTFATFVGKLGYKLKFGNKAELSQSFNTLFQKVAGKGEETMIETIAIRTMSKAYYSTDNIGHYGLSFPFYTHFTSPIRRYPDLMVHRLLEMYLNGGKSQNKVDYATYCEHSSQMERKAADAERQSTKYKQAEYLQNQVGQIFEGHISGVSKYGIFVELIDSRCEGMVSLQTLHDDFYFLDEENYQVIGRRNKQQYKLGDTVKVKVQDVDLSRKRIDFLMVDTQ
ncbi:ribonuclease R [Bacteroidia bacterium]|nr:ribonuclease R [Bacteroidia bacterium]